MHKVRHFVSAVSLLAAAAWIIQAGSVKIDPKNMLVGQSAFVDYRDMKPGTFRKITTADLPEPYATSCAGNGPSVVSRPSDAWPKAPAGFSSPATRAIFPQARQGCGFLIRCKRGGLPGIRGKTWATDDRPIQQ